MFKVFIFKIIHLKAGAHPMNLMVLIRNLEGFILDINSSKKANIDNSLSCLIISCVCLSVMLLCH